MTDNSRQLLNDILCQWHNWCRSYSAVKPVSAGPVFRDTRSGRQWDSMDDVIEREIDGDRMAAVDFHVNELPPEQRTALQIEARNLVTGRPVWYSLRLPNDVRERAILVGTARAALMARLVDAGIL